MGVTTIVGQYQASQEAKPDGDEIIGQTDQYGNWKVVGPDGVALPSSTLIGALTETAPATDTASSGLNGRLQRIAQRITSLIALIVQSTGLAATAQRVVLADDGGPTSASRIVSAAADTNATSAKASAGVLYSVKGYNAAVTVRYLKFYNKATAPTVGTDTPVLTIALPPQAAFALDWPIGRYFATGIAYGMVTGSADNSTAALTAGDVLGLNVEYR